MEALSDYDYSLPAELIAQTPAAQRSASRLLLVTPPPPFKDLLFHQLPLCLQAGDCLVLNDSRVVKARLFGRKDSGGQVEMLLERLSSPGRAWLQLRASHRPRLGQNIVLDDGTTLTVTALASDGLVELEAPFDWYAYLDEKGELPLPPYIHRPDRPGNKDLERYQTVFARHQGSVAAPTAGLHFDATLLEALRAQGVKLAFVTLHVGAGTFLPIRSGDIATHQMHSERYLISAEAAATINQCRADGGRVVCVGTTAVRTLESAALALSSTKLEAMAASTTLFIRTGFRFQLCDLLLTNFHLPRSSLLVLVSAFAGQTLIREAYAQAIEQRFRFFSYGDAMLLQHAAA